jgi:alkylation response protein AidB-like acyl-CoA dehydrogenase
VTGAGGALAIEPAFLTTRDLDRERQGGGAPAGAMAAVRSRLGDQFAEFEARRLQGASRPEELREALAEVRLLAALAASIAQGRVVPLARDDDPALRAVAARSVVDGRA